MRFLPGLLAALIGLPDERKPAAQRGKVRVQPHQSAIAHVIKVLHPKGEQNFHGQSAWKQYKPLHAPRHITFKGG